MIKTGVKEARQHFTEYLAKVLEGEEIIITKREEPIARISPIKKNIRGALVSHKDLRTAIASKSKGKPLAKIVIDSRRDGRY